DRVAHAAAESEKQETAAQGRREEERTAPDQGAAAQAQDDDGRPRDVARPAETDSRYHHPWRISGRAGQEGARRSEPPTGRLDCEEVHEPRVAVPRPDPGREHRV